MINTQLIQDLGGRGEKLLKENLSQGEEVKAKIKGSFGEALVLTNVRLYVLKWGAMAGNLFGGRVNAYDYNRITGIEIRKGLTTGTIEILTNANQNTKTSYWGNKATKSDNAIAMFSQQFEAFSEAVKMARDMMSEKNRFAGD